MHQGAGLTSNICHIVDHLFTFTPKICQHKIANNRKERKFDNCSVEFSVDFQSKNELLPSTKKAVFVEFELFLISG